MQVVTKDRGQVVDVDHVGSAHTDAELGLLLEAARERLMPGQGELDLGEVSVVPARTADVADWTASNQLPEPAPVGGRPAVVAGGGKVTGTSSLLLWQVLADAYRDLGFDDAVGDPVFRALVLARLVEPTSKADSVRVISEIGVKPPGLRTMFRCLDRCGEGEYRAALASACWAANTRRSGGPAALVMYDVTTLLCRCRHRRVYADLWVMPMFVRRRCSWADRMAGLSA